MLVDSRGGQRRGSEITFRCVFPEQHRNRDEHPSASWSCTKRAWLCRVCGARGGYVDLARTLGIETHTDARRIVASYDYVDEVGGLLYQVVRFEPKTFRQRRRDASQKWVWNLDGVCRVLYRLPELLAADRQAPVFIVEGEKDVDALRGLGLTATCNVGGVGKWRTEYNEHLRGRHVVVIPDTDAPGRKHADDVVRHLLLFAASVRRLELASAKDVSDWLAAGHTREELEALAAAAPISGPPAGDPPIPAAAIDGASDPWAHAQSATDLLSEPDSTVEFLDRFHVLVPGCISELFSPRGLGKTHVAWALAVALARDGKRLLYIDRDNSRREVKRRLRAWGGGGCHTLKTLTREKAPALTDRSAWAAFPIADYDVVILDSFDAAAEGVGEQDSTKPSKAIAALLDVARATNGPAVLVLGNVIKSGAHSRGSGVIEDRADIVFEVRDATDLKPTGAKPWWEELAPASADAWAQRATRRKKRDRYRLALVPSKYRVGEEPDPFALEVDLSTEPWQLRNVTEELIEAGEASQREAADAARKRLDAAAQALRKAVNDRTSLPMNEEAIPLLRTHGLKREEARELIQRHAGTLWRLDPPVGRRGVPVCVVPMPGEGQEDSAGMQGAENPCQTRPSEGSIPAKQAQSGRQESSFGKPAPNAVFRNGAFLPGDSISPPTDCPTCDGAGCPDCRPEREVTEL
ncbi:MAG: AAA family ATPase [Candidatus Binatia bacterium]